MSFSAAAVCLRLWVFALSPTVARVAVGDLLANRNSVLLARQKGLYADDKLCQAMNLTSSHQNPVVRQIYVDLGAAPMDNTMYGLLHTHYFQRSQLSAHH